MFALLTIVVTPALAQTQRIVDYTYDAAGNVVGMRARVNEAAPAVSSLSPTHMKPGETSSVLASGSDLNEASVSPASPGLTASDVDAGAEGVVTFTLAVEAGEPPGPSDLTISTRLGSVVHPMVVTAPVPLAGTAPSPVVLTPGAGPSEVQLLFGQSYAADQVFDLAVANPAIATVAEPSVTLLAGTTQVAVHLSGLAEGTTVLEVTQLSNYLASDIPLLVSTVADLLAGWPFDDGMNPTADLVGLNPGTVVGATFTADVAPVAGNVSALLFNGTGDHVLVPDDAYLDFDATSPMSVSMWFKASRSEPVMHLLGKRVGCGLINYQIARDAGLVHFGSGAQRLDTGVDVAVGQFMHFVATYDGGSTLRVYIDGVEVASDPAFTLEGENDAPLTIGASNTCGSEFPGVIDEVRLYARALDADEVATLHGGGP